jgi:hypothetical protein
MPEYTAHDHLLNNWFNANRNKLPGSYVDETEGSGHTIQIRRTTDDAVFTFDGDLSSIDFDAIRVQLGGEVQNELEGVLGEFQFELVNNQWGVWRLRTGKDYTYGETQAECLNIVWMLAQ